MKTSDFYNKIIPFLSTIGEAGKTWDWLFDNLDFSKNYRDSLRNGIRLPSPITVYDIAVFLKEKGCNIFTPKQILPVPFSVKQGNPKIFTNNITELADKYGISATQIYPEFAAKNTILGILREERSAGYNVLKRMMPLFKEHGQIKQVADFVYFPKWGEKAFTFIEYRGKYKIDK